MHKLKKVASQKCRVKWWSKEVRKGRQERRWGGRGKGKGRQGDRQTDRHWKISLKIQLERRNRVNSFTVTFIIHFKIFKDMLLNVPNRKT